jgi:hypothetical protein
MGMRYSVNLVAALATSAAFIAAAALPASAECKSYAFEVNDYGKDGPTKDAKDLLDKLIASKMAEKGIKDFHTGKKTVSCYMFLNFIVFDEYTCSAEAKVCWGGTPLPASDQTAATDDSAATATKASADETATPKVKVAKKKKKDAAETAKATDPTAPAEEPVAAVKDPKSAPVQKAETEAKHKAKKDDAAASGAGDSAEKSASTSTTSSDSTEKSASTTPAKPADATAKPVETGSLTDTEKKPATKPKAEKASADDATVAPIKAKAGDDAGGYPTPMAPSPQDTPNP